MTTLLEKLQEYAKEVGRIKSDGQYPWIFDTDPPTLDNSPPMIRLLNYFTEEQIITFLQDNKQTFQSASLCFTPNNFYWHKYKLPLVKELFSVFVESLKRLPPEDVEPLRKSIVASINSFQNTNGTKLIRHLIHSEPWYNKVSQVMPSAMFLETITTIRKLITDDHWNQLLNQSSDVFFVVLNQYGLNTFIKLLNTIPSEIDKLAHLRRQTAYNARTILHISWEPEVITTLLSQLTEQSNRDILLNMRDSHQSTPIMSVVGPAFFRPRCPDTLKAFLDMIPDQSQKLKHLKQTDRHGNTLLHTVTEAQFKDYNGKLVDKYNKPWSQYSEPKLDVISIILDTCPDDHAKIELLNMRINGIELLLII